MEFAQGYKFKPDGSTVTLFLPAAGTRVYEGSHAATTDGAYWSSTTSSSLAFTFGFSSSILVPADTLPRAYGRSVRCVQQ
jgi:hypothetical protein